MPVTAKSEILPYGIMVEFLAARSMRVAVEKFDRKI